MNNTNKISVIIPVYNVKLYLEKCFFSVANQTYKNLEIILIDDGSNDGSSELCDKFAKLDNRVKVIHQNNKGLSAARNQGIKVAVGKYIAFVDADDWIQESMYEKIIKLMIDHNADIGTCNFYVFNSGSSIENNSKNKIYVLNKNQALSLLAKGQGFCDYAWNKLFKKEIFENNRFPEGHNFEDTYIMSNIFTQINKVVFLDQPLYYYRQRKDSIIGSKKLKDYSDLLLAYEKNIRNPKLKNYQKYYKIRMFKAIKQAKCDQFNPLNKKEKIKKFNKECNELLNKYCKFNHIGFKNAILKFILIRFVIIYKIKYKIKNSNSNIAKYLIRHKNL